MRASGTGHKNRKKKQNHVIYDGVPLEILTSDFSTSLYSNLFPGNLKWTIVTGEKDSSEREEKRRLWWQMRRLTRHISCCQKKKKKEFLFHKSACFQLCLNPARMWRRWKTVQRKAPVWSSMRLFYCDHLFQERFDWIIWISELWLCNPDEILAYKWYYSVRL